MRRLIINADGFGFGAGATTAILEALSEGSLLSSVSVSANFPEAERTAELVDRFAGVSVGVHLNPMVGKPCLPAREVPSLVDRQGFFHGASFPARLRRRMIRREELEAELLQQIDRVKRLAGARLTHLDSQANGHLQYFDLFLAVAQRAGIRRMRCNASRICLEDPHPSAARRHVYLRRPYVWLAHRYRRLQMSRARKAGMKTADSLVTVGYASRGNKTVRENWVRILENLPEGTHEIYCHPGYPDETLRRWSSYQDARQAELAIVKDLSLRELARSQGVEIIGFDAL